MKYCPFCGAGVHSGAVSFCSECGKKLPTAELTTPEAETSEAPGKAKNQRTRRKKKKFQKEKTPKKTKAPKKQKSPRKKPEKKCPEIAGELVNDGYDGYYDDVLPPDVDRVKDGLDKDLVKQIIVLCVCVTLVISMCVVLLYVV